MENHHAIHGKTHELSMGKRQQKTDMKVNWDDKNSQHMEKSASHVPVATNQL